MRNGQILIIIGDFNSPLSVIDRQDRQNISKHVEDLDSTTDQLDPTYSNEYSTPNQQNTCSSVGRTLTNISSSQHSYQ